MPGFVKHGVVLVFMQITNSLQSDRARPISQGAFYGCIVRTPNRFLSQITKQENIPKSRVSCTPYNYTT